MKSTQKKGKKTWQRKVEFQDEKGPQTAVAASPQVSSGSTAVADGHDACTAVADDAEDDDRQSIISVNSCSTCAGDSAIGDDENQGETTPPATHWMLERIDRRREETTPQEPTTVPPPAESSSPFGNIGLLFANWGNPPRNADKKAHYFETIKRLPATIVCIAECTADTQAALEKKCTDGNPVSAKVPQGARERLASRPESQYFCCRSLEENGLLIGARITLVKKMEYVHWWRYVSGSYRRKTSKAKQTFVAYSRVLVVKIWFGDDQSVANLGNEIVIMGVHMHHRLAKSEFGSTKIVEWWDRMNALIKEHSVNVVMGDFNELVSNPCSRLFPLSAN